MMKTSFMKLLTSAIILLFIGIAYAPSITADNSSINNTIYVDDDNTEGPWDGTLEYPYQFIQDGINAAINGSSVYVYSGFYQERILINKSILLQGEFRENTVVDGDGFGKVFEIVVDGISLSDFTIQNGDEAINLHRSSNNMIARNNITNNHDDSLKILGSNNTIIGNNVINNNNLGIWCAGNNNTIVENIITNNYDHGIILMGSKHGITKNTIENNDGGIIIMGFTSGNTISKNTIVNNGYGIAIGNSFYNTITENIITGNNYVGIEISYGSYNTTITKNNITDNNFGIFLLNSFKNEIKKNNFLENSVHSIFVSIQLPTNLWFGNYWDNWNKSFPKPILGTIFILPYLQFDWHPAQEPYDISMHGV